MGALFEIEHANFVGYLTVEGRVTAPRADRGILEGFLWSLTSPDSLISSTKGTPEDWTTKVADAAREQAFKLRGEQILTPEQVALRLDPLRTYFTGYDLYAMVLPSVSQEGLRIWSEQDLETFRRLRKSLQPSRDIDRIAEEIVALNDDVADVQPDAEPHLFTDRSGCIFVGYGVLHRNSTLHGVHGAGEIDKNAVASRVEDATVMRGNETIDDDPVSREGA
jgi:hypothetical protein